VLASAGNQRNVLVYIQELRRYQRTRHDEHYTTKFILDCGVCLLVCGAVRGPKIVKQFQFVFQEHLSGSKMCSAAQPNSAALWPLLLG